MKRKTSKSIGSSDGNTAYGCYLDVLVPSGALPQETTRHITKTTSYATKGLYCRIGRIASAQGLSYG